MNSSDDYDFSGTSVSAVTGVLRAGHLANIAMADKAHSTSSAEDDDEDEDDDLQYSWTGPLSYDIDERLREVNKAFDEDETPIIMDRPRRIKFNNRVRVRDISLVKISQDEPESTPDEVESINVDIVDSTVTLPAQNDANNQADGRRDISGVNTSSDVRPSSKTESGGSSSGLSSGGTLQPERTSTIAEGQSEFRAHSGKTVLRSVRKAPSDSRSSQVGTTQEPPAAELSHRASVEQRNPISQSTSSSLNAQSRPSSNTRSKKSGFSEAQNSLLFRENSLVDFVSGHDRICENDQDDSEDSDRSRRVPIPTSTVPVINDNLASNGSTTECSDSGDEGFNGLLDTVNIRSAKLEDVCTSDDSHMNTGNTRCEQAEAKALYSSENVRDNALDAQGSKNTNSSILQQSQNNRSGKSDTNYPGNRLDDDHTIVTRSCDTSHHAKEMPHTVTAVTSRQSCDTKGGSGDTNTSLDPPVLSKPHNLELPSSLFAMVRGSSSPIIDQLQHDSCDECSSSLDDDDDEDEHVDRPSSLCSLQSVDGKSDEHSSNQTSDEVDNETESDQHTSGAESSICSEDKAQFAPDITQRHNKFPEMGEIEKPGIANSDLYRVPVLSQYSEHKTSLSTTQINKTDNFMHADKAKGRQKVSNGVMTNSRSDKKVLSERRKNATVAHPTNISGSLWLQRVNTHTNNSRHLYHHHHHQIDCKNRQKYTATVCGSTGGRAVDSSERAASAVTNTCGTTTTKSLNRAVTSLPAYCRSRNNTCMQMKKTCDTKVSAHERRKKEKCDEVFRLWLRKKRHEQRLQRRIHELEQQLKNTSVAQNYMHLADTHATYLQWLSSKRPDKCSCHRARPATSANSQKTALDTIRSIYNPGASTKRNKKLRPHDIN